MRDVDALVAKGREEAKEYVKGGWRFVYEPETRFVGVYHPKGGKQSICEISFWPVKEPRDVLGHFIADALNNADALESERSRADRLEKALTRCQHALAMLIDPNNERFNVSILHAWAQCVEAETTARAALGKEDVSD